MDTIRFIALDLDGTLTDSSKHITPRTLQALHAAQEQGATLVIASGRPPEGIAPIARELRLSSYGGYIIAFNGGEVSRATDGALLHRRCLPSEVLGEVCAWSRRLGLPLVTHAGGTILTNSPHNVYVMRNAVINGMPVEGTDALEQRLQHLPQPPVKFLMVGEAGPLAEAERLLQSAFAERLEVCRSTPNFMEIVSAGIDKSAALKRILQVENAAPSQLMAFGDGDNDLGMIRYAGMGIAMSNATPRLREAARFVTLDNDSDGIAHALDLFYFRQC